MEVQMSAIEKKYEKLKSALGYKRFFKIEDALDVLKIKKSTLYWDLNKMVDQGYLIRIGRGKYTLNQNTKSDKPIISRFVTKINKILQETGFQYYISGIDVLLKYMQHVPDSYPVMLFADKYSKEEIEDALLKDYIHIISANELKFSSTIIKLNKLNDLVIIYETKSFKFSTESFASYEKAFVDLYFEVTRHDFPLPLQELVRIYSDMEIQGVIDKKKLIQAAYDRGIHYDIRLIVENKHINKAAFKFVDLIKGDTEND
jgi:hypothetical protein